MTNLYGRNLVGEPQDEDAWPEQDNTQILIDALDKLLDMEHVESVRWTQHTPSFNDGEPCRFGVGTVSVKLTGFEVSEDGFETSEDRWYDEDDEVFLSQYELYVYGTNEDGSKNWDVTIYEVGGIPTEEIARELRAFEKLIDNGAHYAWLMATFGDPAEIVADKEDFHVERYEGE